MLKQRSEQIQFLTKFADIGAAVVAFWLAYQIRGSAIAERLQFGPISPAENLLSLLIGSIALRLFIYPAFDLYSSLRLSTYSSVFAKVLKATLTEGALLGAILYFSKQYDTSRSFFLLFLLANGACIFALRIGGKSILSSLRSRGYNHRRVLVVGHGVNGRKMIRALRETKHLGYFPVGVLTIGTEPEIPHREMEGVPILGSVRDFENLVKVQTIDEVCLAPDQLIGDDTHDIVDKCDELGIPLRVSLGILNMRQSRMTYSRLGDIPMITFYRHLLTPLESFAKRTLDIAFAIVGLAIAFLIYPWISYRIRKESPGPVIFKQVRVGENGRQFKCYKFRTMRVDAEEQREALQAHNEMTGPIFKVNNDPRIFPFGSFLRKTSLDEFPQFLNVLRGDMSIVGTRPPTLDEVRQYELRHRRRLSIRPGITGMWQVNGRNEVREFEDILEMDTKYIDNWSIFLDLRIIFQTVLILFRRKGAW